MFGSKAKRRQVAVPLPKPALVAISISVGLVVVNGVYIPPWLHEILDLAARIVVGG